MIDLLAGAAVIGGAALSLLGAVGLVRLPDALTRMHAAAKAASLGVIATTFAAALETDEPGAGALLILVISLLFLSVPLGSSLLAKAAYRAEDTPKVPMVRDDLAGTEPAVQGWLQVEGASRSTSVWPLVGWMVALWAALFASVAPGGLIGAVFMALLVAVALPALRPRLPEGLLRPPAVFRLTIYFSWLLLVATVEVARAVISRRPLRPGIVRVELRIESPTATTLLMNAITFAPGTVALDLNRANLYVHVLDLRDATVFTSQITTLERLVIGSFGTVEERRLARAR